MDTGQYPPQSPNPGQLWADNFGDIHAWNGNFWVKLQSATMEGGPELPPENQAASPEPEPEPAYCSEEEAADKLVAFETAVESNLGRLDQARVVRNLRFNKAVAELAEEENFKTFGVLNTGLHDVKFKADYIKKVIKDQEQKIAEIQEEMQSRDFTVQDAALIAINLKLEQEKLRQMHFKLASLRDK